MPAPERTLDAAILIDAMLRLTEGETVIDPTIVAGILGRKRRETERAGLNKRRTPVRRF